jgi:RNA polymerase sigma-70 factor, ECF subfamily
VSDPPTEIHCDGLQPPEEFAKAEQGRRLQAALRKLPVGDRSVLALAYIREMDAVAIARIEGCTRGAVKTRLHRAKQKLRELLETDDG